MQGDRDIFHVAEYTETYLFLRFSVKSVQTSRSEMFAVMTSFIECLRYAILLNVNNQDLSNALLKEQVFILHRLINITMRYRKLMLIINHFS